jgi:hypothetical protein
MPKVTQRFLARKRLTTAKAPEAMMLPHPLLQQQRLVRLNRMHQQLLTQRWAAPKGAEESPVMRHHQHPRSRDGSRIASREASLSERRIAKAKATREEASSGGAALREPDTNHSATSLDNRATSMRDVALAGRGTNGELSDRDMLHDSRGVSPVSSDSDDDEQVPAITPPPAIKDPVARQSHSPSRDSRFRENLDN